MLLMIYSSVSDLRNDTAVIYSWFTDNELILNIAKTKELICGNMRSEPLPDVLSIINIEVERVESFTILILF